MSRRGGARAPSGGPARIGAGLNELRLSRTDNSEGLNMQPNFPWPTCLYFSGSMLSWLHDPDRGSRQRSPRPDRSASCRFTVIRVWRVSISILFLVAHGKVELAIKPGCFCEEAVDVSVRCEGLLVWRYTIPTSCKHHRVLRSSTNTLSNNALQVTTWTARYSLAGDYISRACFIPHR
jgi:hypothetical protein